MINLKMTLKQLRAIAWFIRMASFKHNSPGMIKLATKLEKRLIKEKK